MMYWMAEGGTAVKAILCIEMVSIVVVWVVAVGRENMVVRCNPKMLLSVP